MISDRLARFRRGLILGSALTLGVGLASWQNCALAAVSEQGHAKAASPLTSDVRASAAIVVAEKDHDGDDNGDDKKHRNGRTPTGKRTMTIGKAMAAETTVIGTE